MYIETPPNISQLFYFRSVKSGCVWFNTAVSENPPKGQMKLLLTAPGSAPYPGRVLFWQLQDLPKDGRWGSSWKGNSSDTGHSCGGSLHPPNECQPASTSQEKEKHGAQGWLMSFGRIWWVPPSLRWSQSFFPGSVTTATSLATKQGALWQGI